MKLRFILGRAGTGKTHYCLEKISQTLAASPDGPPIIFLVPEQATFQMEYTLATYGGLCGSVRAQVLSFRRLAFRVLSETGGLSRIPVGELGKRMILRRLLEAHKSELLVFGNSAARPGFSDCLARSLGEMKTYLIGPDDLFRLSGALQDSHPLLRNKIQDLALLYRELDNYLADRYTDPDDYLNLLAEKLPMAETFRDCTIWIDGFKGFTPQEYSVIEKLYRISREVNITLCMDCKCTDIDFSEEDLFYPTWETYHELIRRAKINFVHITDPINLDQGIPHRFDNCSHLAHLEKNFFSYPAPSLPDNPSNISLIAASGKRAEVEACAREIIRLARTKGYRWRDMAVFLRDMSPYHDLISCIFQDYGIPCFIDYKRPVTHHPLIELIRSALETVHRNWPYEAVFRYLKTDLVPISREKVFVLENYVLAHGIRGSRWTDGQDWNYRRYYTLGEDVDITEAESEALALINEARREASGALADFCAKFSRCSCVSEQTATLFELLAELSVPEQLEAWAAAAEKEGSLAKAREHRQIWKSVIGLLEEIHAAMGDEQISVETYRSILDAGFESMTIGLIPPGLDQVTVGTLDRSRSPQIKAAFILGVNEGVLPAKASDDGIFTEPEREKLANLGIALAPGGRRRAFEEQFLIYTAITRSSERLWLSYSLADDDGRSLSASPVISRLQELLPSLTERFVQAEPLTGDENECLEFLVHPDRSMAYLAAQLRELKAGRRLSEAWWDLYNHFVTGELKAYLGRLMAGVFYCNNETNLTDNACRRLFGNPLRASVSRIEKFIACPYAHFSNYGLKLKDRRVFRLEAPDMGEFFHAALKNFAAELIKQDLDWGGLSRSQCLKLTEKIVSELSPLLQSEILLSTARLRYLTGKLKKNIDRAVLVLTEHARRSSFRPAGLELAFGPGGDLPGVQFNLSGDLSLELVGRIDRLDLARDDQNLYLRVIDYKSGDQKLRLSDVYHGLKLQLLTYLHAALKYYSSIADQHVIPGGILYFTVREPLISNNSPMPEADVEKAVLKKLRMQGLLLNDPKVLKMMDSSIDSGSSELFPVRIKKDGSCYSNSPVIGLSEFTLLRKHLEQVFTTAGRDILAGRINIEPYRNKYTNACQYCSFKPVCKFDPQVEGNNYRLLPEIPTDLVWQKLKEEEEQNE